MARLGTDAAVDLARIRSNSRRARRHQRAAGLPPTRDADFERRIAADFGGSIGCSRSCAANATMRSTPSPAWSATPRHPGPTTRHLRALDAAASATPSWYGSNRMLGGVCYVDRYAGDLEGVRARIPEFVELGLTYLHLMPLFAVPEGDSDGGYAVTSYRAVAPHLGAIDDLRALAAELRANGISLVLDLIFNHTASDHEWARKALADDPHYGTTTGSSPTAPCPTPTSARCADLPDDHPGSFVQLPDGRWVWATFHAFQWDLNYANPPCSGRWRARCSSSRTSGSRCCAWTPSRSSGSSSAPSGSRCPRRTCSSRRSTRCPHRRSLTASKSEAIVHPNPVVEYISLEECQLSYNPLQMALMWEALATRDPGCSRRRSSAARAARRVRAGERRGVVTHDHRKAFGRRGRRGVRHQAGSTTAAPSTSFYVTLNPGSFARGWPFTKNPRAWARHRTRAPPGSLAGVEAGDAHGVDRGLRACLRDRPLDGRAPADLPPRRGRPDPPPS